MAHWAVEIPAERLAAERLFHHDRLAVPEGGERPAPGDDVAVIAAGRVVALGRVAPDGAVTYTRRDFDSPRPAPGLTLTGPATRLPASTFETLAAGFAEPGDRRTFLVSVDLPIEAETPAEAVRVFWSYVMELGPRELPAFVWPSGQELAMQAYVLGAEANQDPEEDD